MNLLVTNYAKNIIKKPINEFEPFKNMRLKINDTGELEVNECLFYHIFDTLPMMRNIPANKDWFNNYLISKS